MSIFNITCKSVFSHLPLFSLSYVTQPHKWFALLAPFHTRFQHFHIQIRPSTVQIQQIAFLLVQIEQHGEQVTFLPLVFLKYVHCYY